MLICNVLMCAYMYARTKYNTLTLYHVGLHE